MWHNLFSNLTLLFFSPMDGLFILGGFFLTFATHLIFWYRFGRDPEPATARPLVYEPPDGLSPAALRYVWKNTADSRCLAAALLNLAAKGVITIEETGRSFQLRPGTIDTANLSIEEGAIARALIGAGGPVDLKGGDGMRFIAGLKNVLGSRLWIKFKDVYFSFNLKYAIPGNAMAILTAGPYVFIMFEDIKVGLGLLVFIILAVAGIHEFVKRTRQSIGSMITKKTGCLIAFLGFMAIFGATPFLLFAPGLVFPILFTPLVCLVFMNLMVAPTVDGRRIMVQIDGFRHFLDVTERPNLGRFPDFNDAPEGAVRQMPYLLALDVDHPWGDTFAETIDRLWKGTAFPAGKTKNP